MKIERKIILNLCLRYRTARKHHHRMIELAGRDSFQEIISFGAMNEAWNSLEAARQIYYNGEPK